MNGIYRLKNEIKHYDWGTISFIPDLLNINNKEQKPFAELWIGTHPAGTSRIIPGNIPLNEKISLPYLLKVLSAEKPLSIQAHPDKCQAETGFLKENENGIQLDAPNRNYKDSNHKPEIISALTDFTALCGFRHIDEIAALLAMLDAPCLKSVKAVFDLDNNDKLRLFFDALLNLPEEKKEELTNYINQNIYKVDRAHGNYHAEWMLLKKLANLFPKDNAVIAPLYLNLIKLKPEEAIYIPSGILHCYIEGSGIELMANSDNVLRGGLTTKYTAMVELCKALRFEPFYPAIISPKSAPSPQNYFCYETPAKEFLLTLISDNGGEKKSLPPGDCSFIVTEGLLNLTLDCETQIFKRGEAAFAAAEIDRKNLFITGNYKMLAATGNSQS